MPSAHPTERAVGIDRYVSDAPGIGGRLRARPEDFRVTELERFDTEPADADPGAYPHVVLRATLRNRETNGFAGDLSDRLGISRERVSWAGTKDKRAVTTQLFSVQGVDPDDIPAVSGAEIEVVGRAGRALQFGDLAGNAFSITVRDGENGERIDAITDELAAFAGGSYATGSADGRDDAVSVGVPNYFGQQRFGSRRPITHEVGLAIVRGDWEDAVRIYVAEDHGGEPEDTRSARRRAADCFADRDWTGAIDALPRRLGYERTLLHALAEHEEDGSAAFRAALEALPSNLQRLFVHAAQSYAFNLILSERLDRGLPFARPVEGDVVCFADTDAPDPLSIPDIDRSQRVTAARVDTVSRHCERGRAFVTAPLVGTETEFGDGEPGEIERVVLDDLGLSTDEFALPDDWESTGTRRAILVRTDLSVHGDPPTFEFALPKGSYATVLLREYLKVDPVEMG